MALLNGELVLGSIVAILALGGDPNCDADMRRRFPSLDGGASTECTARGDDTLGMLPACICRSSVGDIEALSTVVSLRLWSIGVVNGVTSASKLPCIVAGGGGMVPGATK